MGNKEKKGTPPWNFSWVAEGKLAAMAWPQTIENIHYILEQNIKHLITLSPEKRPPILNFPQLKWTEIPVEEFEAPSLDQILEFIEICEESLPKNEAIGIHCRHGKGRTGVMAACFLVRFQNLAPGRAITNIRIQRPGSVETFKQELVVNEFHDYIRKQI